MVKQFAKNTVKVLVNGVAIDIGTKVIAGTLTKEAIRSGLKSAVISFSGEVLASVGQGLLIEVLTIPLKGNRLPPETLWLNLLEEHPGLIVNPEIMSQAGIHDGAWSTHCHTINRRAYSLEQKIGKLQKAIKTETTATLKMAHSMNERLKQNDLFSKPAVDNTYVAPRQVIQPRYKK